MPRATRYFASDAAARLRSEGTVPVSDGGGAAALWAPPERWRTTASDLAADVVPAFGLFRHRTLRAVRLLSAIERVHPSKPHWYLALLGTRPDLQGHGVGSALVTTV